LDFKVGRTSTTLGIAVNGGVIAIVPIEIRDYGFLNLGVLYWHKDLGVWCCIVYLTRLVNPVKAN